MGKVRTRVVGDAEVEKKQKEEQKKKSTEKKSKSVVVSEVKEEVPKKAKKKERVVTSQTKPQTKPHGKKYLKAKAAMDRTKTYTIPEAIIQLKKIKYAGFDESVEIHLNVDKAAMKGEVDLPHSTGKTTRVAVVSDELLEEIEKGVITFDILVTHPSFMPKLARFAKVLGPRGLMPNPKAGTISANPEELVKKFAKGMLRWKSEPKFPLLHEMVGKVSFDDTHLVENIQVLVKSVGKVHIFQAYIKTTMSPSLKLNIDAI